MKTLFEKLKPEVVELLMLEEQYYPATIKRLTDQLKSKHFFTELTVGDAYSLVRLDQTKRFSIYELTECFNDGN